MKLVKCVGVWHKQQPAQVGIFTKLYNLTGIKLNLNSSKHSSSAGEQKASYLNIKYILRQQLQVAGGQFNPWLWKLSWTPEWSQHSDTCKQLQLPTLKGWDARFLSQIKNWPQLTELFYSCQQVMKVSYLFTYERNTQLLLSTLLLLSFSVFHLHTTVQLWNQCKLCTPHFKGIYRVKDWDI